MRGRARWCVMAVLAAACGERTPEAGPPRAGPASPGAPADDPVARYRADLELVARPRPPGSPHWKVVQDHCARSLEAAGFAVRREAYATGVNVIGERRGATRPDEVVVLGAHYDSVADCAGADDNASGVAGVLAAARALGGGRFARTLLIACWDEEERGLVGSEEHARDLEAAGVRPVGVTVLEMIGFRSSAPDSQGVPPGFELAFGVQIARLRENRMRGDFIALVHDAGTRGTAAAIARHGGATELPVMALEIPEAAKGSPLLRDIRRSDHAPFWDTGVPAMMVTDTANFRNPNYHCGAAPDDPSDLDLAFATRVSAAVAAALREDLQPL